MDIELLLNVAINEAMCHHDRIKNPNSNKIAEFVTSFLSRNMLKNDVVLDNVVEQSEQFKCRNVACKEMTNRDNGTIFCDKHKPYLGI